MNLEKYLKDLEEVVNIESGSYCVEGTNKIIDYYKKKLENDWIVEVYPQNNGKNPVLVARNRDTEDIDIMFVGHNDTVFPEGTLKEWSFKLEGNIATGPGVCDMKSGVLSMVEIANEFKDKDITIALVMNTDEEISSVSSRPIIEKYGKRAKYALVFEPGRQTGNQVIERKGLVKYKVDFKGKAVHSGNCPQDGIDANLECANWIVELRKLHNWDIKNSLNVGLMEGGIGVNTISDRATIKFEGRSHDLKFFDSIKEKMEYLLKNPLVEGVKVEIEEIGYRPPLVLNEKSALLKDIFDEVKGEMGVYYDWESVGGVSDANFLGILGVGVIDAVGPVGGGGHTKDEYLEIDTVEERINIVRNVIIKMMEKKII